MKFNLPHNLVLMFALMVVALVITWIVPSGSFETTLNEHGQPVVVPDSYTTVEVKEYLSPLALLTVVPRALADAQGIIFFVLIIGGAIAVIRRTGAIDAFLGRLLERFGDRPRMLLFMMLFFFAMGSATIGVAEEYIPFAIILVSLCVAMRLDAITAIGTLVAGYGIGYGVAFMNPFTLVVAQNVAGLPPLSGYEFRLAITLPFILVGFHHVWRYAKRVQKDPASSLMYGVEVLAEGDGHTVGASASESGGPGVASDTAEVAGNESVRRSSTMETANVVVGEAAGPAGTISKSDRSYVSAATPLMTYPELDGRRKVVLGITSVALVGLIVGIAMAGWYLVELGALFLGLAIVIGLVSGLGINKAASVFAKGAAELTSTALLIGFARSVALLMEDGVVLHTVVQAAAAPLTLVGAELAAVGMLVIQSGLNFFIPSGSGQAFVAMPLMAPIGDLAGVTRQVSVLAFQFGDGLMNMIVPTNPVLMGILGLAGIPYTRWFRFIAPLVLKLLALGAVVLVIAVWIGYS
jgi:uncharacterized ion transporter superfamily protein YfcC